MIYSNLPVSYRTKPVKACGDEFMDNFQHLFQRGRLETKDTVYVRRSKFPPGVTPIAIEATAIAQGVIKQLHVRAMGIGLTKAEAHKDARHKIRKRLTELSKKRKPTITYGPDEVIICRKEDGGGNVFGRGATFEDAKANLLTNVAELDRMLRQLTDMPPPTNREHVLVMEPTEKQSWLKRLINSLFG